MIFLILWLQVYACGQPTKQGFENILNKVTENYPKNAPIVWINMRQEPGVYVNGQPMCARPPNKESDLTAIIFLLLADYLVWKLPQMILCAFSIKHLKPIFSA